MQSNFSTTNRNAQNIARDTNDGRFAPTLKSAKSVKKAMERDAERLARRLELEALYGEDADMYA